MTVSARVKTLVIDGHDVSARETETILEAAQEEGIFIPTMCHLEGLSFAGMCDQSRRRNGSEHTV